MASVKFEKGSKEWEVFMDVWSIAQKYGIPENTEKYWDDFYNDVKSFQDKHKGFDDCLLRSISLSLMSHFERKMHGEV